MNSSVLIIAAAISTLGGAAMAVVIFYLEAKRRSELKKSRQDSKAVHFNSAGSLNIADPQHR